MRPLLNGGTLARLEQIVRFEPNETNWSRLDYRLLRDGGLWLYYSVSVLGEDVAWLRDEQYLVHEFDCKTWRSEDDFHVGVAATLNFPDYYGQNLNAFNDCIRDVEVPDEAGLALVFHHVDSLPTDGASFFPGVVDILTGAIRTNLLIGRRLVILLHSDNPAIRFEPVGSVPIPWNPREWLNAKRGL